MIKPKNKPELDIMNRDEIEKYVSLYILQAKINSHELKQYMKEFDLYIMLRYKDDVLSRYDLWRINANEGRLRRSINKLGLEMTKLLNNVVNNTDRENYYRQQILNMIEVIGDFEYIKEPLDF